jgi:hypothetical protein
VCCVCVCACVCVCVVFVYFVCVCVHTNIYMDIYTGDKLVSGTILCKKISPSHARMLTS